MPSPFAVRFWGGHLAMVVLLAAAVLLGWWQITVYEGHRADAAIDRTRDPSVALGAALGPDEAFPGDAVGRPVTIAGTWLPQDTVLVSGQEQDGREGYWMVTPVNVTATGSALPVVLGWTADPTSTPTAPSGAAQLTGWLQPSQADDQTDDQTANQSGTVADSAFDVVPHLQTAALVQNVDEDLYDGYAVAQGGQGGQGGQAGLAQAGLLAQPDAGFWTALRNLLYGIQWWVFGGFAVVVWWRWLSDARAAAADLQESADDASASTVKA